MPLSVDIDDRLYDYTDEEKATEALAEFQTSSGLGDDEILSLWQSFQDPRRSELEAILIRAIDENGSKKRAQQSIPGEIKIVRN